MSSKKSLLIFIFFITLIIFTFYADSSYIFSQVFSLVEEGDTRPSKLYKIKWPPVKFAVYYIVQVSQDPMFTWQEDIYQTETENNYVELLLPIGTYYIRIAGVNVSGKRGYFSDVIKLVVEFRVDIHIDDLEDMYQEPETEESKLEKDTNIYINIVNDPNEAIQEDPPNIIPEDEVSQMKIQKPLIIEYPDDITTNIYYYVAINHLMHDKEDLAIYFFEIVYTIDEEFQPEFSVEPEIKELENGMNVKIAEPKYYKLNDIVVEFIEYNYEQGLKMERKKEYKKAIGFYKNILIIKPYDQEIIDRISYINGYI